MRCTKCGYVSFDYLSECKKCRTSLTAAKEVFGFHAVKPAVPSLLASLLRDYEPPAQQENTVTETETFSSLDFGEGFDDGFRQETPEERAEEQALSIEFPEERAAVIELPDESEEDFSLLDLSDEELELLIDRQSLGSSNMEAIPPAGDTNGAGNRPPEPLLVAEPAVQALEISQPEVETPSAAGLAPEVSLEVETPSAAGPAPEVSLEAATPSAPGESLDELALELEDYPQITGSGPQTTFTPELIPKFNEDPTGLKEAPDALAEAKPGSKKAQPESDDFTNDFVIELTENDLETLLEELGSTSKGAD